MKTFESLSAMEDFILENEVVTKVIACIYSKIKYFMHMTVLLFLNVKRAYDLHR